VVVVVVVLTPRQVRLALGELVAAEMALGQERLVLGQ
jgi:hypothetical protein